MLRNHFLLISLNLFLHNLICGKLSKVYYPPNKVRFLILVSLQPILFPILAENIPLCSIADNDKCSNQHFKFNVISVLFITKCLATLKYNSSLDVLDMDGRLLKLAAKLLAPSIMYIFNLSLQRGVIPDDLKLSRITPKFKGKGAISYMSNYRPISVISYLFKILEKKCQTSTCTIS